MPALMPPVRSTMSLAGVSASLVNRMANEEEGNDLDEYLESSL
jgi:hypothetical protein